MFSFSASDPPAPPSEKSISPSVATASTNSALDVMIANNVVPAVDHQKNKKDKPETKAKGHICSA